MMDIKRFHILIFRISVSYNIVDLNERVYQEVVIVFCYLSENVFIPFLNQNSHRHIHNGNLRVHQ